MPRQMPTTLRPRISRSSPRRKPPPRVPNRPPWFPTSSPPPGPSAHLSGFSIRSQQDSIGFNPRLSRLPFVPPSPRSSIPESAHIVPQNRICRLLENHGKSVCVFWLRVGCWCAVACLCWFAFQCAVTVGATVLALDKRPISASLRPLDIYIYAFGSQSCATRLVFEGSAPLAAPTVTALGTSGRVRRVVSHLGLAPAPRAVSPGVFTALRAAMLRRRNTAFSPCDVYHRASAEPSRLVSLSSPLGTPLRFLITC